MKNEFGYIHFVSILKTDTDTNIHITCLADTDTNVQTSIPTPTLVLSQWRCGQRAST